jgi:hypothetical protein
MFKDVLRPLLRPEVEIGVVLERQADQVADRVLRELRQLLGAHFGKRGRYREHHGGKPGRACPWEYFRLHHDPRKKGIITVRSCRKTPH